MLGAAGMIIPEMLAAGGLIPQTSDEVAWFKTGVIPPAGNYGRFWADPYALFFIEVIAFQFAELRRWQDYRKPGSMGKQYFLGLEKVLGGSGNPSYPGTALAYKCSPDLLLLNGWFVLFQIRQLVKVLSSVLLSVCCKCVSSCLVYVAST